MPIKNLQRRRNQGISIKDIASVELTFIDRFNAVSFQITAKPDVIQKITCDSAQIQFPSENLAEIKLPKGQKFYIGDDIYLRLNGIEIQTKGKQSSAKRKVAFIKVVFPEGIEVNSMSFIQAPNAHLSFDIAMYRICVFWQRTIDQMLYKNNLSLRCVMPK